MNQSSQGNFSPNIDGKGHTVNISVNQHVLSNEVKTIQTIINKITLEAKKTLASSSDIRGEINPEKKFEERFREYKPALITLYLELALRYKSHYDEVLKELQPGRTDFDNIATFLRQKSISVLEKNNMNPINALDDMCEYFEKKFAFGEDYEFDNNALRFFLYEQLVKCNIFPNIYEQN